MEFYSHFSRSLLSFEKQTVYSKEKKIVQQVLLIQSLKTL